MNYICGICVFGLAVDNVILSGDALKDEVGKWIDNPAESEGRTGPIAVRHLVSQ